MNTTKPTVFISYSHLDKEWKEKLIPHLKAFEQQGDLILWHDRKIDTGADWYPEIEAALKQARVAVCLISAHFLSSDFIIKEEVPALLKRRQEEGMALLPLLLSPCPWRKIRWLKGMQLFPPDDNCLAKAPDEIALAELLTTFACQVLEQAERPHSSVEVPAESLPTAALTRGAVGFSQPIEVEIAHLPMTGAALFGRETELGLLDSAWEHRETNVLSFVAWGGVGKSTLINRWLAEMATDNYRGAAKVFGWSFYSQGTGERVTSAEQFIDQALTWFGDPDPAHGSAWAKGQRLAGLIRRQRTLLVLDGMEPLQAGHDFEKGRIKDPGLAALIIELARENPGLCLITTREPVADLSRFPETTRELDLEQISAEAGRALLRMGGVRGTDQELMEASRTFGNQALALRLLAAYLHELPDHPIEQAATIPDLDIPEREGRHPRRVMIALAGLLGEAPEVEYLRLLGLFDRPAVKEALASLLTPPAITDLTARIMATPEEDRSQCLARLRRWGLLAPESSHRPGDLDCHPLVREHFGARLKEDFPQAWQEGNLRLYEYYKRVAKEYPDTIEEMAPLFAACCHGCRANRHEEALVEVYGRRIRRGSLIYITRKLGAISSSLAALANFFETIWDSPSVGLAEEDQAWVIGDAGINLQTLGKLAEAVTPIQTALGMRIRQKKWREAAINASNLSTLFLVLGDVSQAMVFGIKSVKLADQSGNFFMRMVCRTARGDALHQAGQLAEAEGLFLKAESIQQKHQHQFPYLYSMQGYLYCDLLLTLDRPTIAKEQAATTLRWAKMVAESSLLDIGLDHLILGQAYHRLGNPIEATTHLNLAVDFLREASDQQFISRGLLARAAFHRDQKNFAAARRDLDESMEIAERCGMRLFLADGHLESCRLLLADPSLALSPEAQSTPHWTGGLPGWWSATAGDHLAQARQLIKETGYHRRDQEVAALEVELAANASPLAPSPTNGQP